jgi:hypothetical protein
MKEYFSMNEKLTKMMIKNLIIIHAICHRAFYYGFGVTSFLLLFAMQFLYGTVWHRFMGVSSNDRFLEWAAKKLQVQGSSVGLGGF